MAFVEARKASGKKAALAVARTAMKERSLCGTDVGLHR